MGRGEEHGDGTKGEGTGRTGTQEDVLNTQRRSAAAAAAAKMRAAAGGGWRRHTHPRPMDPRDHRTPPRAHGSSSRVRRGSASVPNPPPLRATHAWRPRRRARTTKQMESRMFDFPDPFRPVIALNFGSKRPITVRCAYDLKPSTMISMILIW